MSIRSNFWPLDFDPEVEIYDNPSWNLPGRRKKHKKISSYNVRDVNRPVRL